MKHNKILMIGSVDISKDDAPKVHFLNIAKELGNLGMNVNCILYRPKNLEYNKIVSDVNLKFIPNPLLGNIFYRLLKYMILTPILIIEYFQFKPDFIYFRFSPPTFFYLMTYKILNIFDLPLKIIVEFNDWVKEQREIQGESYLKVSLINMLQVITAIISDRIRIVAKGIQDKLKQYGIKKDKVAIIGNGTDINYFKPIDKKKTRARIGLDKDGFYIGFIGNFAVWQGLIYLVKVIPKVLEKNRNIYFLLVGDGPEMSKIKKEINEIKDNVILTGRVPYRVANIYINSFDIGVAPFIFERNADIGLSPLKIWDYAACGIPIIASRIKGLELIEDKGFGLLVPPEEPEALAMAIINLLENSSLRIKMGKRGRKIAESQLSWNDKAKQILNMLKI